MSCARPVITTDMPGCRETVSEGVNGFLVPPRDAEALASAMERFILEPDLIKTMGQEARQIATRRFDARAVSTRMVVAMSDGEVNAGSIRRA